MMAHVKYYMTE